MIVEDLDGGRTSSSPSSALLVTIWELGEAGGPLLIAPLSEVLGRYPVLNGCNIAFIIWTMVAASSQSTNVFILARMFTGLAVATGVLNPAIIGDMFESDKRGSAMSLIMLAPLIGGAISPAISGAIAQTLGWRELLYIASGLAILCELLFLTCFRETYKMAVLRRRVKRIQQTSGEFENRKTTTKHENMVKLWHAITRPFMVLFGSSVLMLISLFAGISFAYFYVMCLSLPEVLQEVYGFTPTKAGVAFMAFSESYTSFASNLHRLLTFTSGVGSFLGVFVCNFSLDRIYIKLRPSEDEKGTPEYRLPLAVISAFALPLSVTAYGWIAEWRLPVPVLLASVSLLGFALMLNIIPLQAYVVDASGLYSASALTGVIVTRCLAGTFLPLATGPLNVQFGYGWGFTCFGVLSMSLAIIPILVFKYGHKWRQSSEFTKDT
jgi:MFS family permease